MFVWQVRRRKDQTSGEGDDNNKLYSAQIFCGLYHSKATDQGHKHIFSSRTTSQTTTSNINTIIQL